jgi:polyamine oxidase
VKHTNFNGNIVELGANWVQGLGTDGGPENPIWSLARKYNITNTYSNYSSILTYNETGYVDYSDLLNDFEDAYSNLEQDAGYLLTNNLQDRSIRAGLMLAGWKPLASDNPMAEQAVEWWSFDFEYATTPEESSELFAITNYNTTFYQWSDQNNFVFDQRGFSSIWEGEAALFLQPNDTRLLLNTVVTNISYSDSGVTVYNSDGSCIQATYAICTFSLGVLQHDVVAFDPPLPDWKETAIATFDMATYTKIFLQFNETFWDPNTQFFLYASPTTRGYYPVFQSLTAPGFLPDSGIIFVTVVESQSYRVERQTDEQTEAEVMSVIRQMFPNITVPDPIAFMYPRWSTEPWAYGSYSNWPVGTTLEMHQNLRANIGNLWFAGEATSAPYYGFLQGAWFEGREVGERISGMFSGNCVNPNYTDTGTGNVTASGYSCHDEVYYKVLYGTTPVSDFDSNNGWYASSFLTYGYS